MNANFEYYKVFYYVSKYENLTKAASVLKTSQPAVTRTIHNLENILGCRLFTRSKSGMKLTPEGKIFYQYVAAGCAQFFKAEWENMTSGSSFSPEKEARFPRLQKEPAAQTASFWRLPILLCLEPLPFMRGVPVII